MIGRVIVGSEASACGNLTRKATIRSTVVRSALGRQPITKIRRSGVATVVKFFHTMTSLRILVRTVEKGLDSTIGKITVRIGVAVFKVMIGRPVGKSVIEAVRGMTILATRDTAAGRTIDTTAEQTPPSISGRLTVFTSQS
jgi:hypothetical protein